MRKKLCLFLVLLVLTTPFLVVYLYIKSPKPFPTFDANTREEWMNSATKYLLDFHPTLLTQQVGLQYNNSIEYWIEGYGFIKFPNGDWICILTNSFHEDEATTGKNIGDVVLAIDNYRNLYKNDAHPCKAIFIVPKSKKELRTLDEFLKTEVDLPGCKWIKYTYSESK